MNSILFANPMIDSSIYNPDPITKSYQQCPRIHVRDSTNIGYMNFRPDLSLNLNCPLNSNFNSQQNTGIDANCLVDALVTNISEELGESKLKIRDKFMAKCSNRSPTWVASIVDTVVPICDARIVQGATDMSSCMINSMQKSLIDEAKKDKLISYSPILFVLFIFFVIVILFIIIIKSRLFD